MPILPSGGNPSREATPPRAITDGDGLAARPATPAQPMRGKAKRAGPAQPPRLRHFGIFAVLAVHVGARSDTIGARAGIS